MKTRLDQFDVLRGGAILLVVLSHWINFYHLYDYQTQNQLFLLKPFLFLISILYPVRMALLFFISGYFCKIKNNFFEKKISRILYPYIIWSLILFFINAPNPFTHKIYWEYIMPKFWGFAPLVWYLYFLFVFYFLTYFLKKRIILIFFAVIFICVSPYIDSIIPPKFRASFVSFADISFYYLYFISGYLFKDLWTRLVQMNNINKIIVLPFSVIFCVISLFFISNFSTSKLGIFLAILGVISSLIIITSIWKEIKKNNKVFSYSYDILCYIGNNSMKYYILHYFFLNSVFVLGLEKFSMFNSFLCLSYIFIFIHLSIKFGSDILFNIKLNKNTLSGYHLS